MGSTNQTSSTEEEEEEKEEEGKGKKKKTLWVGKENVELGELGRRVLW